MNMSSDILTIEGNKYEIIKGTTSDGRCFSASIFYDLYERIPNDNQLNEWIKTYIIDPILNTKGTDCSTFFIWATNWAGMHNGYTSIDRRSRIQPVIITQDISNISDIFSNIKIKIEAITGIENEQRYDKQSFTELAYSIIDTFNKIIKVNPLLDKNITNNINEFIETINKFILTDLLEEPTDLKKIKVFLEFMKTMMTMLINSICNTIINNKSYIELISIYSSYIKSLNKGNIIDGSVFYEWTEPSVGPIDVLLNNRSLNIKSINIHSTINPYMPFIKHESLLNIPLGKKLFLYHTGDHYQPLVPKQQPPPLIKQQYPQEPIPEKSLETTQEPIPEQPLQLSELIQQPQPPPLDTQPPPLETQPPPLETQPPPLETQPPPLETQPPPLETTTSIPQKTLQLSETRQLKSIPTQQIPEELIQQVQPVVNGSLTTNKKIEELKESKEDGKKDGKELKAENVPNSLIIYIKTRIPNFYKLNYDPTMTVPEIKSHTVYFDPLVKYYENPLKSIPSGAPKDALYSQFFEATEFDSMINRILSDFRYMQKPRTFKQAYNEHIIDNNIMLTLKTLFKPNNLFYINKKPYTIVGTHSTPTDWQIDKKPLEKLLNQFSNITTNQLEEQASKEEENIPDFLRQGNLASSDLNTTENISVISSELQKVVDSKQTNKEISGITDSFVSQDKLPGVSEEMKKLYTEYLRHNIPINYSNRPNLSTDPLTLSLLIDPVELLEFINLNKKTNIITLYSAFVNSKMNLEAADNTYSDAITELAIYKTDFDKKIDSIQYKIQTSNNKNEMIQELTVLKVGYMKLIFKIADAIMQIYTLQNVYFISTKALLEALKADYINIIKYYKKPELALKCIDDDIDTVSLLITIDYENPYSKSYYTNYTNFKDFYDKLYKNNEELLNPPINYADDIAMYISQPKILSVEKEQYDLYNFKMFLFYSYNQFDIWVLLFKKTEMFIKYVGLETGLIINSSEYALTNLNNNFSIEQQNNILENVEAEGIKSSFNKSIQQLTWYLVKGDGTKAIKKTQDSEIFEPLYIEYVKLSVKAYDAVILYIYLLEILCLRQNRVYVAEENVTQLKLEFSLTLNYYYNTIIINNIYNFIPKSLLLELDNEKLSDSDFIAKRKKTNNKASVIYRGRIKAISESRNNLVESCDKISQIINPNISKKGFIDQCNNIIISQLSNITPHSFKSSYWLEKTIQNYDIQGTTDFIYNMHKVVKDAWYDRIIEDIESRYYSNWMIYDNIGENTQDSLYAAIADGLNSQLDINDDETDNAYTENIGGKLQFTINSLKILVNEMNSELYHFDLDSGNNAMLPNNVMLILQKTLKIKFIIFEMFLRDDSDIRVGDIVIYQKKPIRVTSITRNNDNILYNLYNGYVEFKEVDSKKIKPYDKNVLNEFRIFCGYDVHEEDDVFDDYLYLVVVKKQDNDFLKIQLVQNVGKPYIFPTNDIPIYIKYLLFNSCPDIKDDTNKIIKMGFKQIETDLVNFYTERISRIRKTNIEDDIKLIEENIQKYKKQLKILRGIKKTKKELNLEQQAEKLLLKEEIKDLEERKKELQDIKEQISEDIKEPEISQDNQQEFVGGEQPIRPSEQYPNYPSSQYNTMGYSSNPNMVYFPNKMYQQPYNESYNVPYNVSQNKSKDQKSKLSFYITIELELFPGTSVNPLQKSVVKCQSTFERIRESWANIFGFQYRPAAMPGAYVYNIQKDVQDNNPKQKTKTIKQKTIKQNKTRKESPN
jgi:hypothetical protein